VAFAFLKKILCVLCVLCGEYLVGGLMKILEWVPNFSEGRDENKVQEVVDEIQKTKGVKLLDYFSNPDHNRTVVTFPGELSAVKGGSPNLPQSLGAD